MNATAIHSSPLKAASDVLGVPLDDVAMYVSIGAGALQQMQALFAAIQAVRTKNGPRSIETIDSLVELGRWFCDDRADLLSSFHGDLTEAIALAKDENDGGAV